MADDKQKFAQLLNSQSDLDQDTQSFADMMGGIKPLEQDKIHLSHTISKKKPADNSNNKAELRNKLNKQAKRIGASFHFSDEYEPMLPENGPLSYVKEDFPAYLAKVLRRGDVAPELILDLHGYNKEQAKRELALFIDECKQQRFVCACVVHGVSGGILKRKTPHYLIQHPDVVALHQAPLQWGGQGAIVFFINLEEELALITQK